MTNAITLSNEAMPGLESLGIAFSKVEYIEVQKPAVVSSINLRRISDEGLIDLIFGANHDAFSELVLRHSKKFYYVAYGVLFNKSEAEDVVQDAFLKFWQDPHRYEKSKNTKFKTWFTTVVTNLAIDQNRKKKTVSLDNEAELEDEKADTEEHIYKLQKKEAIQKLMQTLPDNQRIALNLCYYQGLSNKEAAELMSLHLKALESLLVRARRSLKEKMKKYKLVEVES